MMSLESWEGVAQEVLWKISPQAVTHSSAPTWPLNPEELKQVTVCWPSKYERELSYAWIEQLRHGFAEYVPIEQAPIPQPYPGIVLIHVRVQRNLHEIAIDYSDYPQINEDCAERCALYFKMQFPCGMATRSNVVPGGFVPFRKDIYSFLPHIRRMADQQKYLYDVYGRFGLESGSEVRCKACSLLAGQNHFRWGEAWASSGTVFHCKRLLGPKFALIFPATVIFASI
jgi:hypothetical protein